ncbi:MAG: S41 family peptidase [Euryarchaeota archaeon]|nr:S41 family peptidase [Euryarchaeota archaeon]
MIKSESLAGSEFLKHAHDAVKEQLATTVTLKEFLSRRTTFTLAERQQVVKQALLLFDKLYVHLPQKKAIYAVNPVQRLRLLEYHLGQTQEDQLPDALDFHAEMIDIFMSVRDLHTNYLLPQPFRSVTAYLPFLIEEYIENGELHYLVSKIAPGFKHPDFVEGVEILYWNGIPIKRAIELNAARQAGSNPAARYSRGLESLTIRPLVRSLPPDEEWVVIGYDNRDRTLREMRHDWLVYNPELRPIQDVESAGSEAAHALAFDLQSLVIHENRKVLFAPEAVAAQQRVMENPEATVRMSDNWLETNMPTVFRAFSLDDRIGYIRIFVFTMQDDEAFIAEFTRLLNVLRPEKLIIDVRGNSGGLIYASERLLQLLTPRRIQPEPAQFINSEYTLSLTQKFDDLKQWRQSIASVVETGTNYSLSYSITPEDRCNDIGQRFYGPTLLITDALCYSATDIFIAGFQDHEIGKVLGVSRNTGAGGANVWKQQDFVDTLGKPFEKLPQDAGMRVSLRRTLRVGKRAGIPVEDFGIQPDAYHQMTRADLLEKNRDLLQAAKDILATLPVRKLEVEQVRTGSSQSLRITTEGISRLDLYLDHRPQMSLDVSDGITECKLKRGQHKTLEIEGYKRDTLIDQDILVAVYRAGLKA